MIKQTFSAKIESIPEVKSFITSWLDSYGCPTKTKFQIYSALDEIFSNIANYGYGEKEGYVRIQLDCDEATRMASITFIDNCEEFNPLEKEDPDLMLSEDDRPIGGLGIFLVKQMMDNVTYQRINNCNILTIFKQI